MEANHVIGKRGKSRDKWQMLSITGVKSLAFAAWETISSRMSSDSEGRGMRKTGTLPITSICITTQFAVESVAVVLE
jgi:hypothetical protein